MHLKRWITGLAALPALVYLIVRGGGPFAGLLAAAVVLGLREYFRIVFPQRTPGQWLIRTAGYLMGVLLVGAAYLDAPHYVAAGLALNLMLAGTLSMLRYPDHPELLSAVALQVQALAHVALPLVLLGLIRHDPDGIAWIFMVLVLAFVGDTAALYAGTYWGRHKLCPRISPKKTVEGALGGIGAAWIAGALVKAFFLPNVSWSAAFWILSATVLVAPLGDLFESVLKRAGGIKDSGRILPGHGGILDRIDALLFAAPVVYVLKLVLVS